MPSGCGCGAVIRFQAAYPFLTVYEIVLIYFFFVFFDKDNPVKKYIEKEQTDERKTAQPQFEALQPDFYRRFLHGGVDPDEGNDDHGGKEKAIFKEMRMAVSCLPSPGGG
jgi:hypothetical protein